MSGETGVYVVVRYPYSYSYEVSVLGAAYDVLELSLFLSSIELW